MNGWTKSVIGWLVGALMALGGAWVSVAGRVYSSTTAPMVEEIVARQGPWVKDKAAVEGRLTRTEADVHELTQAVKEFALVQGKLAVQVQTMSNNVGMLVRRKP